MSADAELLWLLVVFVGSFVIANRIVFGGWLAFPWTKAARRHIKGPGAGEGGEQG